MAPTDFKEPNPAPIAEIWPTSANTLLRCALRTAFDRDPAFAMWRRRSTYAVIGEAAHRVSEAAHKRSTWSDDRAACKAELAAVWDGAIELGRLELAEAWSPAVPPSPADWPTYQLARTRSIRRALREIEARSETSGSGPIPGTGIERTLVDPGSILRGRADRIDSIGGHVRVVDLKTGLHQSEPSEDQRRQLLLYAVLVRRTSGEWPNELIIENAAGEQLTVPFEQSAADAALDEVLAAVSSFNNHVASGAPMLDLAKPDRETCRYCPFRTCCAAYWTHLTADWEHRSLRGAITAVGTSQTGNFAVINVESPADAPSQVVHVDRLTSSPAGASRLGAVDLSAGPEHPHVHAHWWSRVQTW